MKKTLVMFAALMLAFTTVLPASARPVPLTTAIPPIHHSATGPWLVGGTMVAVFSLIVCAKVTGDKYHREMTSAEAAKFIVLPFGCLWAR